MFDGATCAGGDRGRRARRGGGGEFIGGGHGRRSHLHPQARGHVAGAEINADVRPFVARTSLPSSCASIRTIVSVQVSCGLSEDYRCLDRTGLKWTRLD